MMRKLGEIADFVGGELTGDPSVVIQRVVHPALARNASDLALVLSGNAVSFLKSGQVQNVVMPPDIEGGRAVNRITVDRPRLVLAKLMQLFERPPFVEPGIHHSAVIDRTAILGAEVAIGPYCWIGPRSSIGNGCRLIAHVSVGADSIVGSSTLLHPGVRIGDRCEIGCRVIIQPNAVIGGDGFAFVTPEPGSVESVRLTGEVRSFNREIVRINSIGHVVIEDDVEIGAGTCVDRGTLGETRIGQGSKLDNLIQVGHNVTIGKNCLIVAQVGLGGSSKIGDRAVVGGQAGLPDHLTIGDDAVVHAQAGITNHVPQRAVIIGSPAQPKRDFLEREIYLKRLPAHSKAIKELKRQIAELQAKVEQMPPDP